MVMLLGKKVGMTQMYDEAGRLLPITVIQAGPCTVMQVKTVETDGYNAIQLGYDDVKPSRRKNPQIEHAKRANSVPKKFVKEMRLPNDAEPEYKVGDSLTVSVFAENKYVDVVGTGFARYGTKTQSSRLNWKFCQRCRPRRKPKKRQENGRAYGQPQSDNKKP